MSPSGRDLLIKVTFALASISTVPGSPNTRFPPYGERLGGEKHVIDLTTEFFMRRIQHPE